jgi:hypothetical protein
MAPSGDRLCVVHAASGSVADIDPDLLVVKQIRPFAATGEKGKPNARISASGELIVNVDNMVVVVATGSRREIATPGPARGLALGAGDEVWAGHPNGVIVYDLASGKETGRITVPGLYTVKHVRRGPA